MAALGLAWDIQAVPQRIYQEAKAVRISRAARTVPSVTDATALPFALVAEPD